MADSKLSALTEATTLGAADELYVNDSGTSKRITYANLLALIEVGVTVTLSQVSDVTSTAAELNILDGVTSTTAELNILDGVTANTAEVNLLDGATALLTKSYASSGQTITSAAPLSLNHGLGVVPLIVTYKLICTTDDAGYVIGDEITMGFSSSSFAVTRPNVARLTTTTIEIRFNDAINVYVAQNKSTGSPAVLTNSSWELYVGAYA